MHFAGVHLFMDLQEEKELIESSPYDYYWGCGGDGSGKNRLGKILMEVRTFLKPSLF